MPPQYTGFSDQAQGGYQGGYQQGGYRQGGYQQGGYQTGLSPSGGFSQVAPPENYSSPYENTNPNLSRNVGGSMQNFRNYGRSGNMQSNL